MKSAFVGSYCAKIDLSAINLLDERCKMNEKFMLCKHAKHFLRENFQVHCNRTKLAADKFLNPK